MDITLFFSTLILSVCFAWIIVRIFQIGHFIQYIQDRYASSAEEYDEFYKLMDLETNVTDSAKIKKGLQLLEKRYGKKVAEEIELYLREKSKSAHH